MSRKWLMALAVACVVLPVSAQAQEEQKEEPKPAEAAAPSLNGWGISLGWFVGNDVTKQSYPGIGVASIDDGVTVGGLWYHDLSARTRFEAKLSFSPNSFVNTPNGDVNALVWYLDLAYIPYWTFGKTRLGIPFGLGWAGSHTSGPLADSIPNRDEALTLNDGSGMQYFIGAQAAWRLGQSPWSIQTDLRTHRFHRIVNVREINTQIIDVTVALTRSF
ncbi:MAG: hypothetical protein U0V87_00110 [Acidobacteriota bacterium]